NDALPPDLTTDLDGNPRIKRMVVDRGAYEFIGRFYVDDHASGDHDGSSWPDAFTKLQDALVRAKDGDEIWIAAGIYYPDEGIGQTACAQYSTFNILPGVSVYGGFAGTETELEERDWEASPTVLSGDIDHESEPDEVDVNGVVIDADNIKGDN